MKPSKFDIFYWWGIIFSSIPVIILVVLIGVGINLFTSSVQVQKVIVTEVINIEQEPQKELIQDTPKVEPKTTTRVIVEPTVHHTVQDTIKKIVSTVTDTTKKID
jgi:hypothetical protein